VTDAARRVPADVYAAARRAYVLSSRDLFGDDETVRAWAEARWGRAARDELDGGRGWPWLLAFWVMSIAAQDGHA
jgi:hypothetical protein